MIEDDWTVLGNLHTPFLCVFSTDDHVGRGNHTALSGAEPGQLASSRLRRFDS